MRVDGRAISGFAVSKGVLLVLEVGPYVSYLVCVD